MNSYFTAASLDKENSTRLRLDWSKKMQIELSVTAVYMLNFNNLMVIDSWWNAIMETITWGYLSTFVSNKYKPTNLEKGQPSSKWPDRGGANSKKYNKQDHNKEGTDLLG